jgi:regulation of enolase protein 1 (concanavalin A-like superfamily)
VPLPPDLPKYRSPAALSQLPAGTAAQLTWLGGLWAHNYDIYFGTTPTPPLLAANVNLGPSTTPTTYQSYTTPVLAAGQTYYWKIVSKTMASVSAAGPVWSFTTPGTPPGPLPAGWSASDIGGVGVPGYSSSTGGSFTVAGSGADVWGTADAFRYTYQSLSGDGQMVARVTSIAPVNSWTKAGVMIRNSLSASSAYAFMIVSVAKGSVFQYRASAGASAASIAGSAVAAPYWVKIVRNGNTITGYQSANGSSWTLVGSASIPMGPTVQIGLAVTSHDNTRVAAATFDQISR